jgi:hypothetical protein
VVGEQSSQDSKEDEEIKQLQKTAGTGDKEAKGRAG